MACITWNPLLSNFLFGPSYPVFGKATAVTKNRFVFLQLLWIGSVQPHLRVGLGLYSSVKVFEIAIVSENLSLDLACRSSKPGALGGYVAGVARHEVLLELRLSCNLSHD